MLNNIHKCFNIKSKIDFRFVHDDNQQTSATQDHLYSRLPNVLQIQLMRFQGDGRKSNKRVEFHNELDLSILIPDKIYKLHSVLGMFKRSLFADVNFSS